MNRYSVVIEEQASIDIEAHARWILSQGAPLNAARWIEGIEEAIASLSIGPERCAVAPEAEALNCEIRQLLFRSHRVLFVVEAQRVHVLHVRHAARQPLSDVPESPE